jgi:prevent-host-death family protein
MEPGAVQTVNIHHAKTHLSRLVDEAAGGREIVIARAGKPVARLLPLASAPPRKRFGLLKGRIRIPAGFDAPLPGDVLDAFEGRDR